MATDKAAEVALGWYLDTMSKNYKVCDWKHSVPQQNLRCKAAIPAAYPDKSRGQRRNQHGCLISHTLTIHGDSWLLRKPRGAWGFLVSLWQRRTEYSCIYHAADTCPTKTAACIKQQSKQMHQVTGPALCSLHTLEAALGGYQPSLVFQQVTSSQSASPSGSSKPHWT